MAYENLPSVSTLRKLLEYRPADATLWWRERTPDLFGGRFPESRCKTWNTKFAGSRADRPDYRGARRVRIFNLTFFAHTIIWTLETGAPPRHMIDHINGDPSDNSIGNLRDVPQVVNSRNMRQRIGKSGFRGVTKERNRWRAQAGLNGKVVYIGSFDTPEEAAAARRVWSEKYGFTERHFSGPLV